MIKISLSETRHHKQVVAQGVQGYVELTKDVAAGRFRHSLEIAEELLTKATSDIIFRLLLGGFLEYLVGGAEFDQLA